MQDPSMHPSMEAELRLEIILDRAKVIMDSAIGFLTRNYFDPEFRPMVLSMVGQIDVTLQLIVAIMHQVRDSFLPNIGGNIVMLKNVLDQLTIVKCILLYGNI